MFGKKLDYIIFKSIDVEPFLFWVKAKKNMKAFLNKVQNHNSHAHYVYSYRAKYLSFGSKQSSYKNSALVTLDNTWWDSKLISDSGVWCNASKRG